MSTASGLNGSVYGVFLAVFILALMAIPLSAYEVEACWGEHSWRHGHHHRGHSPEDPVYTYPAGNYSGYHYYVDVIVSAGAYDRYSGDIVSVELNFTGFLYNGTHIPGLDNSTVVPSNYTHGGDVWRCEVIPFDGEEYGESGSAEVTISSNQPPVAVITLPEYIYYVTVVP